MTQNRSKLELVDDPVKGRGANVDKSGSGPTGDRLESTPATARSATAYTSAAAPMSHATRYSDEPRKAVFGRLPRTLTRRLERALVELREDADDLTQEQVLAALLLRYVDPADPERMHALAHTVAAYRQKL